MDVHTMIHLGIQLFVFAMGIYSVYKAVGHMVFFWKVKANVGRSMIFFMLEQVVSSTCTLVFSFNSLAYSLFGEDTSILSSVNSELAIALRLLMFGAMIHSTEHLSMSIRAVLRENAQGRDETGEDTDDH